MRRYKPILDLHLFRSHLNIVNGALYIFQAFLASSPFERSLASMADQYSQQLDPKRCDPPSIFIFNNGRTRDRQCTDGPNEARLLLHAFISTLKSIEAKGYIVQGAMYGPDGASIFIYTDDEDWCEVL